MAKKITFLFMIGLIIFYNGTSELFVKNVRSMTEKNCSVYFGEKLAKSLHIYMTETEIINMLGSSYKETNSMLTNEKMWRFDLCQQDNYIDKNFDDSVDLQSLRDDLIKYIIFFTFSNDGRSLNNIAIYYKDNEGYLYEHMHFSDGTTKRIILQ